MKKRVANWLFLAVVFAITLWSIFHGENLSEVLYFLKTAKAPYLVIAVSCVIFFILGEAVVIYYLLRILGSRVNFLHCCLYSFIGFFYSAITPSATGGQPMQIIAMRKGKIPIAVSTVVLGIVTITYKSVLVLFGLSVAIFRPASIMHYIEPVESLIYFGLSLNIIFITILFLLVFKPKFLRIVAEKLFFLLNRIHLFRDPEKKSFRLNEILKQYEGTSDFFRIHMPVILNVFLITFVQRCFLFLITWFTYKAFTLSGHSAALIVSLQAMISVAADMIPLPGGMVFNENLFLIIFNPIFGENLVLPGMLISRGISYYTQIVLSGIMTVIASFVFTGKNLKGKV